MRLPLLVIVVAGFCIGSANFLERDEKNEQVQKMCLEPESLYIHYRVHQGDEYQEKFPVGTQLTYRCGVGYLPRDIKAWNATCRMNSDGTVYWEIDKYDCRPVSCGHPGDIRWGRLMDAVFVFPRHVRYQCNKGYRMVGDAKLSCQSDGTWDKVKPECRIVDCGPLNGIDNGTVNAHGTEYGSKAEFTCNDGFKLSGASTRTCDADGQWSDESPHCEEIWCPQPEPPEVNGTTSLGVNPGRQRSGTRLQYFCPPSTALIGSEINVCRETGSWLFERPKCIPNCVVQPDPSAAVMRQSFSRYNRKEELAPETQVKSSQSGLFAVCKEGYELIGRNFNLRERTLRCESGTWEPPGPWCREKPCRNLYVQGAEPEYMDVRPNEVMNFTCKPKHTLQKKPGAEAPICKLGRIYGDVPICKPENCVVQHDPSAAVMHHSSWYSKKEELAPGTQVQSSQSALFVVCKEGYEFIDGNLNLRERPLRCESGTWEPPGPWCTEKPCRNFRVQGAEPEYIHVLPNQVVNFTCKTNYTLQKTPGATAPICSLGWIYGDVPTCKPDDCRFEDLHNRVEGGTPRQHQNISHGSIAIYDCGPSLVLDGPGRLHCHLGSWIGHPPKCVPSKVCSVPDHVGAKVLEPKWPSTLRSPSEVKPGTIVQDGRSGLFVNCEDGYRLKYERRRRSKQLTLHCTKGTWHPPAPWCEKSVPSASCQLPKRENRFKAHHKNIRVLPLDIVDNGTVLVFHCEPVGETVLGGSPSSQCINGRWTAGVPYCYGKESARLNDIHVVFQTEIYTVPGGVVYVEPESEVRVECWSSAPVYSYVQVTNAQYETTRSPYGHYIWTARFTVPRGRSTYIECGKADTSRYRRIAVFGHDLYRCPEIPQTQYMDVRRRNREVYEFRCRPGFRLQGKSTVHCLGHGVLGGPVPSCVPLNTSSGVRTAGRVDSNQGKRTTWKPVVTRPVSTPADTLRHTEGIRNRPKEPSNSGLFGEPTVHTASGDEEPLTNGGHGHNAMYAPGSPARASPESNASQPTAHRQRPSGTILNYTRVEDHETSSSDESTRGHVTGVNASREYASMPRQVSEKARPGVSSTSQNESSRSVTCAHHTDSGLCNDPSNHGGATLKGRAVDPVTTVASVVHGVGAIGAERHREADFSEYTTNSSFSTRHPQQSAGLPQNGTKVPGSTMETSLEDTQRQIVNSSVGVQAVEAQDGCEMIKFFDLAPDGLIIVTENMTAPLNSTFWPSCDGDGYTLVGNSSAVTCLQNGSWDIPPQIKCIEKCANFETGPNGAVVAGRKPSYALGDSITLSCNNGTQLRPPIERITCLGYSWSEPAVPICVPAQEEPKIQQHEQRAQRARTG